MLEKLLHIAARILVVMFFTGLFGCLLMILVSWIEIFSEVFTDDEEN